MKAGVALPNIYAYQDYRKFLTDWLAKKQTMGAFSMRWLSKQAGFKSPNLLSLIVRGKRNLGMGGISKLSLGLGLGQDEGKYFESLVLMNQADSPQERMVYYERIVRHAHRRKVEPMERGRLTFFQHWIAPVLYEMVQFPDFDADPHWIASQFDPAPPVAEVKTVWADLVRAGLVFQTKNGKWRSRDELLLSPTGVRDIHLYAYHEQALEKAADALHDVPVKRRNYRVLTSAISDDVLPDLRALAEKFEADVWDLIGRSAGQRNEVIQVSLQIFPVINRKTNKL